MNQFILAKDVNSLLLPKWQYLRPNSPIFAQGILGSVLCIVYIFQQKLKEEREAKRAQLDERHGYLLTTIADSLAIEKSEVEDSVLEGAQVKLLEILYLTNFA